MTNISKSLEKKESQLPKLPKLDVVGAKDKEVMYKPEKLRLVCNKCSKEWIEKRPEGYCVRYKKENIFLLKQHSPYDKKLFTCPKCKNQKNIGRLSLVIIIKNK